MEATKRLTGVDISPYKDNVIQRRLRIRAAENRFDSVTDYLDLVETDPGAGLVEARIIASSLCVPVSSFFRDPAVFETLETAICPELFLHQKTLSSKRRITAWSLGCSKGQEAYSLAIAMFRFSMKIGSSTKISIMATDIDAHSLEIAAKGRYSKRELSGIPETILTENFTETRNGSWIVNEQIRKLVQFKIQNALDFSSHPKDVDLILCRNLLIYLRQTAQDSLLQALCSALKLGGFLILGGTETILGKTSRLFNHVDAMRNAYQKTWDAASNEESDRRSLPRKKS